LLPSSSELQNWAKKVEDVSTILCGNLQHYQTDHGECIRFQDLKKVFLLILEGYGLTEIAKQRSVSVSQSMDGVDVAYVAEFKLNKRFRSSLLNWNTPRPEMVQSSY
jgi:hypothetical protein